MYGQTGELVECGNSIQEIKPPLGNETCIKEVNIYDLDPVVRSIDPSMDG